jgi:hypothetical protein
MGIPCIDRLGERIEDGWRAAEYAPSAFPALAERSLRDANLPAELSADDVAIWALRTPKLPQQADPLGKFGQPPVTLFRGARFYIDALHWLDGTTTIHQHGFSGAFQVLKGSSIETLFAFELARTFDGHFVFGALQVSSSGLLGQGDVRPIQAGPKLIHSLFHLDRPSVSIVVRSNADPDVGPQFDYSRAGIGSNPFFADETADRKLQMVSMLRTVQHPRYEELVGDLVAESDLHTAYRLVRECGQHSAVDRLIDRVRDKDAAARFRAAMKNHRRERFLVGRRSMVTDAELRFFLGVLLNVSRRRDVLTLTRQRKPDADPPRQVAAWLRQLSNIRIKLQAEGAPWQPNLLGLPDFDDELERACVGILSGEAVRAEGSMAVAIAQLRALPGLDSLFND